MNAPQSLTFHVTPHPLSRGRRRKDVWFEANWRNMGTHFMGNTLFFWLEIRQTVKWNGLAPAYSGHYAAFYALGERIGVLSKRILKRCAGVRDALARYGTDTLRYPRYPAYLYWQILQEISTKSTVAGMTYYTSGSSLGREHYGGIYHEVQEFMQAVTDGKVPLIPEDITS